MEPNHLLRQAREAQGWSQKDLGDRVGTNRFTICRWEQGTSFPTPHFRQMLCKVLATTPACLGLLHSAAKAQRPFELNTPPVTDTCATVPHFLCGIPPCKPLIGQETIVTEIVQRLVKRSERVALYGIPGIGKTAIAAHVAHEPAICQQFSDGIVWISAGKYGDVRRRLCQCALALGIAVPTYASLEQIRMLVRTTISTRKMLLIVDDIWHDDALWIWLLGGPLCSHLVTTRFPWIAAQFDSQCGLAVPPLEPEHAIALLECDIPRLLISPAQATTLLTTMAGGLPLAIRTMGYYLQRAAISLQQRRISAALAVLHNSRTRLAITMPYLPEEHPSLFDEGQCFSVQTAISLSVQLLSDQERAIMHKLVALLRKPALFSERLAASYCRVDESMVLDALDSLTDKGLVQALAEDRYAIHPTIADYFRFGSEPM
ncbi:MAG: helix-turn-helix domain-containing protein [Ktedonobacteraceae bacterium]|nr:helix-turn-helix domain-containing protein [Ktedonobacteraceae bacterium]MBA3822862.1 helix-turn-helix domain-containing protein [Ktedonobacterales bacterium]